MATKMVMIERIKNGVKPTEILREIKAENPNYRNFELANIFCEYFGGLSLDAIQAIWYWRAGRSTGGFDDNELDAILTKELQSAGLL